MRLGKLLPTPAYKKKEKSEWGIEGKVLIQWGITTVQAGWATRKKNRGNCGTNYVPYMFTLTLPQGETLRRKKEAFGVIDRKERFHMGGKAMTLSERRGN